MFRAQILTAQYSALWDDRKHEGRLAVSILTVLQPLGGLSLRTVAGLGADVADGALA
jgi:hypothetical protein